MDGGLNNPLHAGYADAGLPQAVPCSTGELSCTNDVLEECDGEQFQPKQTCEHACIDKACVECKPTSADATSVQCGGNGNLVPQRCNDEGKWELNPAALDGGDSACRFACTAGACSGTCTRDVDRQCAGDLLQSCTDQSTWDEGSACPQQCKGAACVNLNSCMPVAGNVACAGGASCCKSNAIPGGSFERLNLDGDQTTLAPFWLDRFEVTVARFRHWIDVYSETAGRPAANAGKNPNNPDDPGWDASWNALLPADHTAFDAKLSGCAGTTWKGTPNGNDDDENRPINCINWYEAFAFCIWDGGRLPTDAEWSFAAAGGSEQLWYPWSKSQDDLVLDHDHAVYYGEVPPTKIMPVGSKSPLGDARWGTADLSGNLSEWVLDTYVPDYESNKCDNCARFSNPEQGRTVRGGSFKYLESACYTDQRDLSPANDAVDGVGFRCAR